MVKMTQRCDADADADTTLADKSPEHEKKRHRPVHHTIRHFLSFFLFPCDHSLVRSTTSASISLFIFCSSIITKAIIVAMFSNRHLLLSICALCLTNASGYVVQPPVISPATGLLNRLYEWRKQSIRYQVAGDASSPNAVILVHGLFVNADHWRKQIKELAAEGYRVYAVDLLGSGYSSKPLPWDENVNELVNGENGRFYDDEDSMNNANSAGKKRVVRNPSILENVQLGTSNGGTKTADVDLRHPLGSPYNFYTWSEQICDFAREVVLAPETGAEKATLVGNSKGTIVSLQAALDCPDLFNGAFLLNPTFREQHSAEAPKLMMPLMKAVQGWLRTKGSDLFTKLAKPDIVKKILKEPYAVSSAVDDQLVDALLSPLLSPNARDVVFDTLSYTAGPLPEQQLNDPAFPCGKVPVWVATGSADPWTPIKRINSMEKLQGVEKVITLPNIGHCPHDEAPGIVNPLLLEFFDRVNNEDIDATVEAVPVEDQSREKIWNRKLSPAFVR